MNANIGTIDITIRARGIPKRTNSHGNVPLPKIGPMSMAKLLMNLLTPCANP